MRRGFLVLAAPALLVGGLAMGGCSRGWTAEQEEKFVVDCIGNLQLADAAKKQAICECWFDKASSKYSYEVVKNPTREMGRAFIQWGKECSAQQGLAATIARPPAPAAPEAAAAAPTAEAPAAEDPAAGKP